MSEQMRNDFETFAVKHGHSINRDGYLPGAPYMETWTAAGWESWQAALATQPQAPQGAVTPGFQLVPIEPTDAMLLAGATSIIEGQDSRPGTSWAEEAGMAYKAMALAAPKTDTPEGDKQ